MSPAGESYSRKYCQGLKCEDEIRNSGDAACKLALTKQD